MYFINLSLSILPIIPYSKCIPIVINLFLSHHLLAIYNMLFFKILVTAHGYIVVGQFV